MTWFGGIYQDPKQMFGQFPCEPEKLLELYPEIILPEDQKQKWLHTRTGAIIGRKLVERFGWKIGQRVPLQTSIWPQPNDKTTWEFDIVGIFDATKGRDTSGMYMRYDYFDEARAYGKGLVGWYGVRVADPNRTAEIAKAIDEEFANSNAETKSEAEKAFAQGFIKQIGDIGTIMVAILSAVFFTILLVTGNTMAQAVRERTEELGVLKALGFTNTGVMVLVLLESCFLAVLGGGIGLLLAWILASHGDPTGGYLPVFHIPNRDLVLGAGFILILGLASGMLPAWQAMRLRIADALRR
jgi:putative ABC transport system permease protein